MTLLEQAQTLSEAPLTPETLDQLEALAEKAEGQEKEQISDLIEAAIIGAPIEVIEQINT